MVIKAQGATAALSKRENTLFFSQPPQIMEDSSKEDKRRQSFTVPENKN